MQQIWEIEMQKQLKENRKKKKKKSIRKNLYFFILSKREKRSAHLNLWDTNKELTYQDKL